MKWGSIITYYFSCVWSFRQRRKSHFSSSVSYHREYIDNENKSEYFVEIEWLDTVLLEDAVKEVGMFGNQNTICKPTATKWLSTIDRLKSKFPEYDNYDNVVV